MTVYRTRNLINTKTDETLRKLMSDDELEEFLNANPDWAFKSLYGGATSQYNQIRRLKYKDLDSDFRNMLSNMKKANPGSTIDY